MFTKNAHTKVLKWEWLLFFQVQFRLILANWRTLFVVGCFLILPFFSNASTFTSNATGNWHDVAPLTWTVSGGADADGIPDAGDDVVVRAGCIITINAPGAACLNLTIGDNNAVATVTIAGANTLAVGNNLAFNINTNGSNYTLNVNAGSLTVANDVTAPNSNTGNKFINVTTGSATFNKNPLTWPRDLTLTVSGAVTGLATFAGALTINAANATTLNLTNSGALTFNGLVTLTRGTIANSGTAGTMNFNAGFSLDNNNGVFNTMAGSNVNFGGNFTVLTNAETFNATSNVFFNAGAPTVTPTANITFGNVQVNNGIAAVFANSATGVIAIAGNLDLQAGAGTSLTDNEQSGVTITGNVTLGSPSAFILGATSNITVNGNWVNNGGTFTPGLNTVTFNGGGTQTITKAGGEIFYNLTSSTTGPLTLGSNVTVTNLLTMTAGNYNLATYTLTLGVSGFASTLTRATGTMYGGTFQRFIPTGLVPTGVSSTGAPIANYYGLFPVGTALAYRPVEINSTVAPTSTGYISASHIDGFTTTDLSPAYDDPGPGPPSIQRIKNAQFVLASASLGGGTYNIDVSMTALGSAGLLADIRLAVYNGGTPIAVGTHAAATGSVSAPTAKRTGLNEVNLNHDFRIATADMAVTPLGGIYYAREIGVGGAGIWSSTTSWSRISPTGASCGCIPGALDDVSINGETAPITMTVDGNYSITNVILGDNTGTDNDNATLTVAASQTLTITGTASFNLGDQAFTYVLDAANGIINLNGANPVVWTGVTNGGQSSIRVGTGTITFASLVTIPSSADEDITYTGGAGTINFNGGLTVGANGIFTTVANCIANFAGSYTNNINPMVWNAASNVVFTGAATITPTGAITFGNFQINSGITVTQAGNVTVAGNWINNGGTLAQSVGGWTVTFTGTLKTIGGTVGTAFPNLNIGTSAIDATISLTGGFTYSCVNLTIDDGAGGGGTPVTFTHSSTEVLNVSGFANLIQPTTNGQTNVWYINAGTATVTGNLDFDGASINARIIQVIVTSGSLTVNGAAGIDWMEAQPAATALVTSEVISLATGTITIANPVTMNTGSGTINVTGAGTLRFNGAPALDFGSNPGANPNVPVFTTISGSVVEFGGNLTTTNTAPVFSVGSTEKFTGNSTITPNAAIAFGNVQINAAPTVTLAGNISVTGNWTNLGGTLNAVTFGVTFNGTGTQTIVKTVAPPETFYNLTSFTTGGGILQLGSNIMVANTAGGTLTMTAGNYNLNGYTLTLGNLLASTLSWTAGTMYGGTFTRYIPGGLGPTDVSSTGAPIPNCYGLFPIGSSTQQRPVAINSTAAGTGGSLSALHTDANTTTDVSICGATVQRITDQASTLTNTGIGGAGVYNLDVNFSSLSTTDGNPVGLDLRLTTPTGCFGTHVPISGSVDAPTGQRDALSITDLANTWVIGTVDAVNTPLRQKYYSMVNTDWDDNTAGNWSNTSAAGPTCSCAPSESTDGYVVVGVGHTVTVNVAASASFVEVLNTGTLQGSSILGITYDLTTTGSGRISPTTVAWTVGRNMTMSGTGNSSVTGAAFTVGGKLNVGSGTILTMSGGGLLTVSGDLQVDGTLSMGTSGATLDGNGAIISGGGSITQSAAATFTLSNDKTINAGANLTIDSHLAIASPATITNNGAITLTNTIPANISGLGAASIWTNASGSTLNIAGALLAAPSVFNASAAPNTVNYIGGGAQTIIVPASSYYNLTCSNAGTKTMGGTPITIAAGGKLTIQDAAILDESTNVISGAGGLTMTGTSELKLNRGASGTYPELTGAKSLTGGTITIDQTAGTCTVRGATYYNLKFTGNRPYNMTAVTSITNNFDIQGTSRMTSNAVLTVGNAFTHSSTSAATALTNNMTVGSYTQSNGTVTDGGNTITVTDAGGWTKSNGTFSSTGTVRFTGTVAQSISGASSTSFNNLTIFNTSTTGVTLSQPVTIAGVLTLTDGYLYADNAPGTNFPTLNNGASVSPAGGSLASFVDGQIKKIGSAAFIFPTGDDLAPAGAGAEDIWARMGVSAQASATQEFTATYFAAAYGDLTMDGTLQTTGAGIEYWTLDRAVTANDVNVTLYWEDATRSGISDPASGDLVVARYSAAPDWTSNGQSAISGASPGWVTSTLVSSFNTPFTFGSLGGINPLPVDFLSFDAESNNHVVDLSWSTAAEFNSDYFIVQRSQDGNIFEDVVRVEAAGNSSTIKHYSASDPEPYSNISYYRLKQVDNDGKFSYTGMVAVKFEDDGIISIYPNPSAKGEPFNVSISGKNGKEVLIVVRDLQGREFYSKIIVVASDMEIVVIDTAGKFAPGMYFVVATSDNSIFEKKIVVR